MADTVEQLVRAGCGTVIVVDDGSGPGYAELFARAERVPGVVLLRHEANRGKGAALKTGFRYVLDRCPWASGVVTIDADGQHLVKDALATAATAAEKPGCLVLGARRIGPDAPWRSRFGNRLTRTVFRVLIGHDVSDTQTGLRAVPAGFLPELLSVPANRYDFELEMLVRVRAAGIGLAETPIETVYLENNASSHFDPVFDSLLIYFSLFRFTLSALAAVVADYIGFALAYSAGAGTLGALAVGRIGGTLINFNLNRRFVFHHQGGLAAPLVKFLLLVVVLAAVSYGLIEVFAAEFGIHVLVAKAISETLLFSVSYVVQRNLVFAGGGRRRGGG